MFESRRGILLAGGSGTRLYPATISVSKQLLPIYDKPMVYYALSTLMLAGIRQILVISTPHDLPRFQQLLGNGEKWGIELHYVEQPSPDGLAQAFILGKQFLGGKPSAMVLGDNIFYGHGLAKTLVDASRDTEGATVFAYHVPDPERYGVVAFDSQGAVTDLQEKPSQPRSNFAVTGLYFYDEQAAALAEELTPSPRGELEITDLNRKYLERGALKVKVLGRGYAWLDTGTHEAMLTASQFIQTIEARQSFKVCCPEEIAWRNGWIDGESLQRLAATMKNNSYGRYLAELPNFH